MNNYKMIDIVKYIAAIMVIYIHCNQQASQEHLNFFIKQVVCRIAVPFFFICSAYFVRRGCHNSSDYLKIYLRDLIKSYLAWSIIFIPIGLDWIHQNLEISANLLPLALIFGLIHVGTYYHLWYIPALIFSIFLVDKLLKRIPYKIVFLVSIFFFLFGSLETYYSFLPINWFRDFFDVVIKILFTTRSGLFFGMIFTVIGFFIYDYQKKLKSLIKYVPALTLLFGILLIIEGAFLYHVPKLDMNFLIMLAPFSFFFFLLILYFPYTPKFDTRKFRELSKYYYFIHPISIVIVEETVKAFNIDILSSDIASLLLILFLTHILCSAIILIKMPLRHLFILISAFVGIIMTTVLAGLFYWFKPNNILVKFELVPCLWVFLSFVVYILVSKLKNRGSARIEK